MQEFVVETFFSGMEARLNASLVEQLASKKIKELVIGGAKDLPDDARNNLGMDIADIIKLSDSLTNVDIS